MLEKLGYVLFIFLYKVAINIAALFNQKARQWVHGRKNIFTHIQHTCVPANNQQRIWMHCASLGEFEQGRPLIEAIKKNYPAVKICLTFFSPSGYEIQKNYAFADNVYYLPIDSKKNAQQFIEIVQPTVVFWVKYEYWHYYLKAIKNKNIPLLMVAGLFRQQQPFFKWYGHFWQKMLHSFSYFFVQNQHSVALLHSIGITNNITVGGDTRFDRVIAIAKNFTHIPAIQQFCGANKVIVAGSTWDDDEAELIHYVRANPGIKFIIAPHQIDAANVQEVQQSFKGSILYSHFIKNISSDKITETNVLIIDNIGMLSTLYYYAHITYVGGGFNAGGIHNVLEAAVYGKPVIIGPVYQKFIEAVALVDCGAAISIENALQFEGACNSLFNNIDVLQQKGSMAKQYVYTHAGATQKVMDYIQANRLLTN
jgi:3-deoxy-D-manno-octulosonic-acid transferase